MTLSARSTNRLVGGLSYNRVEAPQDIPEPPAFLTEKVRDEFVLICMDLNELKPGLSTRADRIMLIGFARAMALFNSLAEQLEDRPLHTRTLHGEMKMSPYFSAYMRVNATVMRYCTFFGLNPMARARLPAPPHTPVPLSEEEREIDDLFA